MKKKILGIIPSRLSSSRVKQKPLYEIDGIPLIIHVVKRASMSDALSDLIVATDSEKIHDLVLSHGYKAILTSKLHKNGTERITEVANIYNNYDCFTLINGDEILLNPSSIEFSINSFINSPDASASILAVKYNILNKASDFKIVLDNKQNVIYISRADIPYYHNNSQDYRLKAYHIMTFSLDSLNKYVELAGSTLEDIEGHEHLRFIENGLKIKCTIVDDLCISLDTHEDIPIIKEYLKKDKIYAKYKI